MGPPLEALWNLLAPVTNALLGQLDSEAHELTSARGATGAFIDAWRYKEGADPCPGHTDAGFLTTIAQDSFGLEVRVGDEWVELDLAADELAVMAGRMCAQTACGVAACVHRVNSQDQSGRCSIGFEIRPDRQGALALAEMTNRRLLGLLCRA